MVNKIIGIKFLKAKSWKFQDIWDVKIVAKISIFAKKHLEKKGLKIDNQCFQIRKSSS